MSTNVDQLVAKMQKMTEQVKTQIQKNLDQHGKAHNHLKEDHIIQEKILAQHVKKDPLPREKIDQIKAEIMEDIEAMSPRSRKGKGRGLASESSKVIDSEDDIAALDVEKTSMEDLIKQINVMNESIPKRLEKFQVALEEKQKVTDAKMKRMIKDSSDKMSKTIKTTSDGLDKLKKGMVQFQSLVNNMKGDISEIKKTIAKM